MQYLSQIAREGHLPTILRVLQHLIEFQKHGVIDYIVEGCKFGYKLKVLINDEISFSSFRKRKRATQQMVLLLWPPGILSWIRSLMTTKTNFVA